MASNISVGDEVYVCRNRLPGALDNGKAFLRSRVLSRQQRSVSVELSGGAISSLISTKFVHHRVGIAVITFGDFHSESVLLDPLAKTVLQYSRLLIGDDSYVRNFKIRTENELNFLVETGELSPYDHIVILGHGSNSGKLCGALGDISGEKLAKIFETNCETPWNFTFLCCFLGRNRFARKFSQSAACQSMVAPYNSVHGAVSAQFVQTYLIKNLLEGETISVAHRHASASTPPKSSFRLWANGTLAT